MELNFGLILLVKLDNLYDYPVPDNLYDYDYNNEGLDKTVHGAEIFTGRREFKKLLDILRSK